MQGSFSEDSLQAFNKLASEFQEVSYGESGVESYDFTRCVRPDGSAYGTGGKCRKGLEQELFGSDGGISTGVSGGRMGGTLFGRKAPAKTPNAALKPFDRQTYGSIQKTIQSSKKMGFVRNKKAVDDLVNEASWLLDREKSVRDLTGGRDNAFTALYQPLGKALSKVADKGKYKRAEALHLYNQLRNLPGYYTSEDVYI